MRKWISMLSMVLVITLSGSLKVSAEVRTMPDGQLFDPEFYGQFNTDVAAIFGTDADTLYWHYLTAGKEEGRLPYLTEEMVAAMQALAQESEAESGTPGALQTAEREALAMAEAAAAAQAAQAEAEALAAVQTAATELTQNQDPAQALLDALVKAAAETGLDPQVLKTATGNLFEEMLPMAAALTEPEIEQAAKEAYRQFEAAFEGLTQQVIAQVEVEAQAAAAAQAQAEAEAQAAAEAAAKQNAEPQLKTTKELGTYLAQPMTDSISALGEPMLLVENNGGYIAVDATSGNYSAFSLASNKLCGPNTVGAVEIYLNDKGWSVYGVRIGMTAEQAIKASANYGFTPENVNAVPNGSLYLRGEGSWIYVGLDKSGKAVVVDGYTYPYAAFGKIFG